jgi:hypothetical protein
MRIYAPLPITKLHAFCNSLLSDTPKTVVVDAERDSLQGGNVKISSNAPSQGLPAWLMIYFSPDGPLPDDYDDAEFPAPPPGGCVEVSLDTGYAYKGPGGEGCARLHARLVEELGTFCETHYGASWWWHDEFTDTWHEGREGLTEFA